MLREMGYVANTVRNGTNRPQVPTLSAVLGGKC
jgi:hypothetical protein